jgi:hypothetical protein
MCTVVYNTCAQSVPTKQPWKMLELSERNRRLVLRRGEGSLQTANHPQDQNARKRPLFLIYS